MKQNSLKIISALSFICVFLFLCSACNTGKSNGPTPTSTSRQTPVPEYFPKGEIDRGAHFDAKIIDSRYIKTITSCHQDFVLDPPQNWIVVVVELKNTTAQEQTLHFSTSQEKKYFFGITAQEKVVGLSGFVLPKSISGDKADGFIAGSYCGGYTLHDYSDQEYGFYYNHDDGNVFLDYEVKPGNTVQIGLVYTLEDNQSLKAIEYYWDYLLLD